ncbi:MAG: hypothetical protein ACD_63C00208G0001 [uncultured bacterium]|nr:MAG: hypothetical protein ACD_63C00208G0001 [uncultured bacterium]
MSKSKIFFFLCLSFIAGIGFASFYVSKTFILLFLLVLGTILVCVFWERKKIVVFGFCIVVFVLGIFRFGLVGSSLDDLHVSKLNDSGLVTIIGRVVSYPDVRVDKVNMEIEVEEVNGDKNIHGKILVYTPLYPRFDYADRLEISGKLFTPPEFEDFSYRDYLSRFGIHSVMFRAEIELIERGNANVFLKNIFKIKSKLKDSLRVILHEPQSGFAQRLILGEYHAMSSELLEMFKRSGVMHIIAISGYHITIVAAMLTAISKSLGKRGSFIFAICGIVLYTILTGATASVVRSSIMGILVLVALNLGRLSSIRNALVLAALAIVAVNPQVLRLDIGFQLSFLAVIGIVYISPYLVKVFRFLPNVLKFRESIVITLSAQITTLPLVVYDFGKLSVVAPIVNFVLLPSIPLSMGLGFLASVVGMFDETVGRFVALPAWLTLGYGIYVVKFFSEIPLAYIDTEIEWIHVLISYVCLVLFFVLKKFFKKRNFCKRKRVRDFDKDGVLVDVIPMDFKT